MKRLVLSIIFMQLFTFGAFAQRQMSTEEYIDAYKQLAIESMEEYGIPTSINMAQALVESDSGNSILATEANNHFGIKCKSDWTGGTISYDDDAKDECFRRYKDVYDSFKDHSDFLTNSSRYRFLFDLEPTDYESWAHGLSDAGYATNPEYANILIRTIETNKLYLLDEEVVGGGVDAMPSVTTVVAETNRPGKGSKNSAETGIGVYDGPKFSGEGYTMVKESPIPVYKNNKVPFVIAREGDTFASLAKTLRKSEAALLAYNDLKTPPATITPGSIVYIGYKKSKARNGYVTHNVSKGETLYYVSQRYGIRLNALAKLNGVDTDYQIKPGQKTKLRK